MSPGNSLLNNGGEELSQSNNAIGEAMKNKELNASVKALFDQLVKDIKEGVFGVNKYSVESSLEKLQKLNSLFKEGEPGKEKVLEKISKEAFQAVETWIRRERELIKKERARSGDPSYQGLTDLLNQFEAEQRTLLEKKNSAGEELQRATHTALMQLLIEIPPNVPLNEVHQV